MEIFPWKIGATPKRREGSPRRRCSPMHGQLRLREPGNMECGLFGPLR